MFPHVCVEKKVKSVGIFSPKLKRIEIQYAKYSYIHECQSYLHVQITLLQVLEKPCRIFYSSLLLLLLIVFIRF